MAVPALLLTTETRRPERAQARRTDSPPRVGQPTRTASVSGAASAASVLSVRSGRVSETSRSRARDTRHGCATLLVACGVPPRVVMEILGHRQIGLTVNVYTHVSEETRREALGHMDRLLKRRRKTG